MAPTGLRIVDYILDLAFLEKLRRKGRLNEDAQVDVEAPPPSDLTNDERLAATFGCESDGKNHLVCECATNQRPDDA